MKGVALSTLILCCQGGCGEAGLTGRLGGGLRRKEDSQAPTHRPVRGSVSVLDATAAPPLRVGVPGEGVVQQQQGAEEGGQA